MEEMDVLTKVTELFKHITGEKCQLLIVRYLDLSR